MATKQQQERRDRALERAQAASGRTPQQQLARLDGAGEVAVRERLKLAKRISASNRAMEAQLTLESGAKDPVINKPRAKKAAK